VVGCATVAAATATTGCVTLTGSKDNEGFESEDAVGNSPSSLATAANFAPLQATVKLRPTLAAVEECLVLPNVLAADDRHNKAAPAARTEPLMTMSLLLVLPAKCGGTEPAATADDGGAW